MFNKDFYPTPTEVVNQMLIGVDVPGSVVLEPSAGKGNIVDVLSSQGADQVLTFEKEKDLAYIVSDKSTFLGNNFFECTPQQVSHIDAIIMNPPFSADERHILHAWEVAPEGCHIVALCNSETIDNNYSRDRKKVTRLISDYGKVQELGDCFSDSERKTGVEVSMIELFKPVVSEDFDYEGFYMDVEPEEDYPEGLIPHNEVRSIVSRYVSALKCFDEFKKISEQMESLVSPIGLTDGFEFKFSYNKGVTTKKEFAKELQKESWKYIFNQMNISKFVTSGVMSDINKFVETQSKYPFTMKNIYRMIEIIIGTREQTMERALVEAFDKITKHYDENRYQVEGWKTNSHYLINEKFILPYMVEEDFNGNMSFKYSSYGNTDRLTDLNKALCYITGKNNELGSINRFKPEEGKPQFHTWYDWGFLEIKGFKKGTLHCKFKDEKVWSLFNRRVAEIKGFPLPEKVGI